MDSSAADHTTMPVQPLATPKRASSSSSLATPCDDPWALLPDDMLVAILARLPFSPLRLCKAVCRRWASVIATPEFHALHKQLGEQRAMLLCYRTNHLVRSKSQAFAYDEESRAWLAVPPMEFPAHNYGSLAAASGLVYAIAGPGDNKLRYKLTRRGSSPSSFLETWCKTPAMGFARHAPVVSVVLGTGAGGRDHKVVVAGGVPDYEREHMAVEVFDSETGSWEVYGSLPDDFSGNSSRLWMSGTVANNQLYVSLIRHWTFHAMSLETRLWSPLVVAQPAGLIYHHVMAIGSTLVVAGLCARPEGNALKLWRLEGSERLVQIGTMDGEAFATLGRSSEVPTLHFLMNENVIYVSKAYVKDGAWVMGEVDLAQGTTLWRVLPSVSSLGYRFDSMVTFCTTMNVSL